MSTKAHVAPVAEKVVAEKFTLPKAVKNDDAHFIAEHGVLKTSKSGEKSINLSQGDYDKFLETKGTSKEEHARVFAAQEAFAEASVVVAGHLCADVAKKAKKEGLEGDKETVTVKAATKGLRPTITVTAHTQSPNPKTGDVVHSYGTPRVRFQKKFAFNEEIVKDISDRCRAALED